MVSKIEIKHNMSDKVYMYIVLILIIICVISNGLIIYYLNNLEGETCNCVLDWRHNYLKYASVILGLSFLILFFMFISPIIQLYLLELTIFISLLVIVNGFIFNDYIKYLETSKCNCALNKQKKLNTFLYYYIYVSKLISIIIGSIILFLFIMNVINN